MHQVSRIAAMAACVIMLACGSGGGGSSIPLAEPTGPASYDLAEYAGATCPGGTTQCGSSGYCCPTGSTCAANTGNQLGCGSPYCCFACAGAACGAGCCGAGSTCTVNTGGSSACTGALCCTTAPQDSCPPDVAARCPGASTCLPNRSARYCDGGYACYLPGGQVGCPDEVLCPNGIDFCPSGTYCGSVGGACAVGSQGGNYCCLTYAHSGESCDVNTCAPGLSCVTNPHCANSDPYAANTCKGSCGGSFPVDCGNFCCSSDYPICGSDCTCYGYF